MLLLLLLLLHLSVLGASTRVAPAPAYYPRLALLRGPGGTSLVAAAVETPTPAARRLLFLTAPSPQGPWPSGGGGSVIASAAVGPGPVDLGNGFLSQLPNGTLLCAYRHHDGLAPNRTFRIQLSSSQDFGATWALAATIAEGALGVWEPFLFFSGEGPVLRVAYSAELPAVGGRAEQDIVFQESSSGGSDWGPVFSRVHTAGSRNGMPGVASLQDGSLLLVHEGFGGVWGAYRVSSARSFDGGVSWVQREVVHAPASGPGAGGWDAGSPQVAVCPAASGTAHRGSRGAACAVFMSNEGGGAPSQPWPAGAHAALLCAPLDATNASAPLDWGGGGAPATVATETPSIYWPSFYVGRGGSSVAYQGEDGAAYVSDADVCSQ